ncbi:MAG: PAS domain S-box protein [Sulfuricellaceae bacterium]|nr:PAS domain S-box protein [Sulfuricellaceae bacterium]
MPDSILLLILALLLLVYAAFLLRRQGVISAKLGSALRKIENQQFALDQHAIVSITDVKGNITYANDRFCQISQYSRNELMGENHRILKSGEHSEGFFRDMWRTVANGKVWHGQIKNRAKDGSYYWLSATVVPFMDANGKPYEYISIRSDITALKQMEAQLNASHYFLKSLTDALGEGIYALDSEGKCTFLNQEAERLLGWRRDELIGRYLHDTIHFQTMDGHPVPAKDCPTHKAVMHGQTFHSESDAFTRKDGQIFPISVVSVPLTKDGEIIGSVAAFKDISQRLQEQKFLLESEKKFRSVVESLSEVVFQTDWQGLWTYLNPVWEEITGHAVEKCLGTNMLNYIHPDDAQKNFESFMPLIERRVDSCRYEVRFSTRDGSYCWLEVFARLVLDEQNQIVGTTGVLNDVTERRLAEDRLRDELQFSQQLLEVIPYPIFVKDVEGRYLGFNKAFETFWGIDRNEWAGKTVHDLLIGSLAEKHQLADNQVFHTGATLSYEAPVQAGDRLIHETVYQKTPFRRSDGSIAGLIGIISDVTEAKRSAAELEKARDAAEAANRAKSDFLANMSHEIRTPMNGIIGMTDMTLDTELTATQREYLGLVKTSAHSLLTIINDILDFSKIEAGKLEIESIPFDLGIILDEITRTLSLRATEKGVSLSCTTNQALTTQLEGDPVRLRQILLNLVGNAIKFTAHGEIEIRADSDSPHEDVIPVHISVRDTGIGIPEDKIEGIFSAFSQADSSITRKFGGTGLGLSITRQLVAMMGGQLWVESQPGVGSTFHFTARFKAARERLETNADPGEQAPATPVGLNILLAEDNPINQKLAVTLLSKAGHQVSVANNGLEAIEQIRNTNFDLVLMDMQMPEMGGIEATLLIREHETILGGHVPIIALTANAMQGDQERCLSAGMDAYLSKPIQKEELFRLIARTMDSGSTGHAPGGPRDADEPEGRFDYLDALSHSDKDIIDIIGAEFLSEIPGYLAKIESALNKDEAKETQRAAHTFKGVIGNFGAKPAARCAGRIEQAAETGDLATAKETYLELQTEVTAFQQALQHILANR